MSARAAKSSEVSSRRVPRATVGVSAASRPSDSTPLVPVVGPVLGIQRHRPAVSAHRVRPVETSAVDVAVERTRPEAETQQVRQLVLDDALEVDAVGRRKGRVETPARQAVERHQPAPGAVVAHGVGERPGLAAREHRALPRVSPRGGGAPRRRLAQGRAAEVRRAHEHHHLVGPDGQVRYPPRLVRDRVVELRGPDVVAGGGDGRERVLEPVADRVPRPVQRRQDRRVGEEARRVERRVEAECHRWHAAVFEERDAEHSSHRAGRFLGTTSIPAPTDSARLR